MKKVILLSLLLFGCSSNLDKQLKEVKRLEEIKIKTEELFFMQAKHIEHQSSKVNECFKPLYEYAKEKAKNEIMKKHSENLLSALEGGEPIHKDVISSKNIEKTYFKYLLDISGECEYEMVIYRSMIKDLATITRSRDSIDALHTNAVLKLSKLKNN